MKKFGDVLLIIALTGVMAACEEECTKKVYGDPGKTVVYYDKHGQQYDVAIPQEGVVEIPCEAKGERVEALQS